MKEVMAVHNSILDSQSGNEPPEFTNSDTTLPLIIEFDSEDVLEEISLDSGKEDAKDNGLLGKITERLAAFALLYDIPFCYLMPGEELLPPNSLRFFYLDPNWVFALMDGALSPGRTAKIDIEHDRSLTRDAYAQAMRDSERIRRLLQGREPLAPAQVDCGDVFKPELCTGFVLRSPLVTGWRGLEFNAFDAEGAPMQALRIETLAHDVLLALFLGEIDRFTLAEPPEGLHYGMNRVNGSLCARLRSFENGKVDGTTFFPVFEGGNRVIHFAKTAEGLAETTGVEMDSAKLALQLTRTAQTLRVNVKGAGI